MLHIPLLAWAAAGLLVVMTVAVNLWMLSLRRRDPKALNRGKSARRPMDQRLEDLYSSMSHPFLKDQTQLRELSEQVEKLKQHPPNDSQE